MLSPRWRKVVRDLWGHKARTMLVVISIAVGVFAVGMVAGSQVIIGREMNRNWQSVNPANASIYADLFDEEMLWTVRHMPDVKEADARRSSGFRFKVLRDGAEVKAAGTQASQNGWRDLSLYSYLNFADIRIFQLRPVSGAWPPGEHEVLIERSSLDWMGARVGDAIVVETPNGKQRTLRIAGTVHDLTQSAASWVGRGFGYVTGDTMEWLGLSAGFDELDIVVSGDAMNKDHVRAVAEKVRNKVEASGRQVYYTWIPTPGKHPAAESIDPILMILGALGFLSLVLSGFLVINTMQAQLAQQVRQIGIMKAVGGQADQILGIYYAMVLIYAMLALAVGVPLGALAANWMSGFMAVLVNFDITGFGLSPQVLALELAVGLLVPVLAALYPIISAVRVSARKAMSDYGIPEVRARRKPRIRRNPRRSAAPQPSAAEAAAAQPGGPPSGAGLRQSSTSRKSAPGGPVRTQHGLRRVLSAILSRPLLLSLRNTFRRRGRLALTLATLTLAGGIFIAVYTVRDSLTLTLNDMYDYIQYDVAVFLKRPYRIDLIQKLALGVPGVTTAESWDFATVRRVRPDDSESDNIMLYAPNADSPLVHPTLVQGRWLLPEDDNAIVVNTLLLKDEPDIKVGDTITLKINRDKTSWVVVGIMKGTPPAPMIYANYSYLAKLTNNVGRSGVLFIVTDTHDPASQARIAQALEDTFKGAGVGVSSTLASTTERAQIQARFNVLVLFLLIMAVLLAVVGGIGLMGTMSLNVLERTREIGVMRAVGATGLAITQIVIVEGLLIGLISWAVGTVLAYPLSKGLTDMVGNSILRSPLSYTFSTSGMLLWLALAMVLASLASLLPARNASRISVREVLAYE
jgi:putative ABC transport system permease protein